MIIVLRDGGARAAVTVLHVVALICFCGQSDEMAVAECYDGVGTIEWKRKTSNRELNMKEERAANEKRISQSF